RARALDRALRLLRDRPHGHQQGELHDPRERRQDRRAARRVRLPRVGAPSVRLDRHVRRRSRLLPAQGAAHRRRQPRRLPIAYYRAMSDMQLQRQVEGVGLQTQTKYTIKRRFWSFLERIFRVYTADGQLIMFVKHPLLKLREEFQVYGDEAQTRPLLLVK